MVEEGGIILEIMELLGEIGEDNSVPRNVRAKIKNAFSALNQEGKSLPVKINASIQELDECSDDPNVPAYVRTQIWDIVSRLESI